MVNALVCEKAARDAACARIAHALLTIDRHTSGVREAIESAATGLTGMGPTGHTV